jgi:bifunctional non-homologous end joining protein LigD
MDWITPMEPISSSSIPSGEEWIFQIKWDGIRGLTYYQRRQGEDHVRIFTKSGRERTEYYPELHHIGNLVAGNNAVLDGEMVVPDNDGKPSFHLSLIREKTGRKDKLPHYIRKYPVIYIVFDILYLNDCLLTELPLKERRNILYQSLNQDGNIAITEDFEDGPGLYDLMKRKGWEGIVSKKKNSLYCPAKNHSEWFKLETTEWSDKDFILLNNLSTLVWLGNQAALELHTGFHRIEEKICPTDLVFDLDPSEGQFFNEAAETALLINETLIKLSIRSWVKTSGATGLQIYIPTGSRYDYETARKINRSSDIIFHKNILKGLL